MDKEQRQFVVLSNMPGSLKNDGQESTVVVCFLWSTSHEVSVTSVMILMNLAGTVVVCFF
jgi:hypothetical protein